MAAQVRVAGARFTVAGPQVRVAGAALTLGSQGQVRVAGAAFSVAPGPQVRVAGAQFSVVGSGGQVRVAGATFATTAGPQVRVAGADFAISDGTFTLPRITAAAGPDLAAKPFQSVPLDASASANLDGSIAYTWTQIGGPAVTLSSTSAVAPTFTAPATLAGATLTFQLAVSDGTGAVRTDTVAVTVARHNFFLAGPSGPIPLKITQL